MSVFAIGHGETGLEPDRAAHVALFVHGHLLRVLAARWLGLRAIAG